MALFTNKSDQDLPLLTQFYQLEFDPKNLKGSELDVWVGSDAEPGKPWSETANARFGKDPMESLQSLADAHPTIKTVMECLADGTVPDQVTVDALNKLFASLPPFEIDWPTIKGRPFIAEARSPWINWPTKIFRQTISELIELMEPMLYQLGATSPFVRCEECRCPYQVVKSGQVYCSTRCRHRRGQRRRMRELYAK